MYGYSCKTVLVDQRLAAGLPANRLSCQVADTAFTAKSLSVIPFRYKNSNDSACYNIKNR
jgi:hypothetical protein